ncbi:hypothetical protein EJB05_03274, partial [Eragrostis curvula]
MALSALLPDLLNKAGESLSTEFSFMWGIEPRREKLHTLLLSINQVITDAEEQAYKKPVVKSWLAKLKLAACDAEDVLDELHYEALRSEALLSGHKINSGVRAFFSPHYNPLLFKYKIGKRLEEIVEHLGDLVRHMDQFGFMKDQSMPIDERMLTHSYVDEQDVIGREGDKKKIVHALLGAQSDKISVFSIVGIGGLGKTTLAQLVFNNAKIKNGFQKHMWVCVSEEFNVADIAKKIIVSANGYDPGFKNDNMELLQQRLRKELRRQRCLLVLDDVWNKDAEKWDALRTLFGSCGVGSALVVTTRDMEVASVMGAIETFHLEQLSPDDSWTLFRRRAFNAGICESPDLVNIGKKIMSKCHGVPLAVKSMGSLMSTKQGIRDWLNILESSIWTEETKILPALMVSYKHLPSYMKRCFAFCAVFPKDYEIDKFDLVHCWIASGFIPSGMASEPEAIGNDIFSQLVWRSFFQDVQTKSSWGMGKYGYRDVTTCKIHALVHDLAVDISGNDCFCLHKLSEIKQIQQDVCHLSCPHPHKIGSIMQRCPTIRSIFSVHKDQKPVTCLDITNPTLRILGLHIFGIKEFSFEPAFMKHLRYLDLSRSLIEVLPEGLSMLYNLEALNLNYCSCLNYLPEGMKYMVSLRHVYLDGCRNLKCMPADLGQLSSLWTLTMYKVSNEPGRGIKELRNLKLGGKLQICDLIKVNNPLEAKEADIESKIRIEQLKLSWISPEYSDSHFEFQVDISEKVLEALKPHNGLKVLKVKHYAGSRFPRWMTDNITVYSLVELSLNYCFSCTQLPLVCRLPCLEVLKLKQMKKMRYLCTSNTIDGEKLKHSPMIFPKLKFLSLKEMELLEMWDQTDICEASSVTLPLLDALEIIDCPKLASFPHVPVLKSLIVEGNRTLIDLAAGLTTLSTLSLSARDTSSQGLNSVMVDLQGPLTELYLEGFSAVTPFAEENKNHQPTKIEVLSLSCCDFFLQSDNWFWACFTSLKCLILSGCNGLTFWPNNEFRSLSSLIQLNIEVCENFTGLSPDPLSMEPYEGLHNLVDLQILWCPSLVAFPTCLPSLQFLTIFGCFVLESLPNMQCPLNLRRLELLDCYSLSSLPQGMIALKSLDITNCPQLEDLPEGLQQMLPNLETFSVDRCPALARKCKPGGDYWDRVKNVPELEVTDVITTVEQNSSWQHATRAIFAACKITWYRVICELISAWQVISTSMVHLSLPLMCMCIKLSYFFLLSV